MIEKKQFFLSNQEGTTGQQREKGKRLSKTFMLKIL